VEVEGVEPSSKLTNHKHQTTVNYFERTLLILPFFAQHLCCRYGGATVLAINFVHHSTV
jgi:hypothetical protein